MLEEGDQCGEAQRGKDRMASLAPREVGRHQVLKRHRRAGQAIPWAVQQLAVENSPHGSRSALGTSIRTLTWLPRWREEGGKVADFRGVWARQTLDLGGTVPQLPAAAQQTTQT